MHIIHLEAENIKRIRAVSVTPGSAPIVEITGRNGQGKSSTLDAIWWALAGAKHIQAMPIRKGETKALIRLDLGDLKIERRFTDKGSYLDVETLDGARYKSPQEVIDKLIGALAFDPMAFVRMKPETQMETLRKLVHLDIDLDDVARRRKEAFTVRTEVNRSVATLTARVSQMPHHEDAPADPIDEQALLGELAGAGAFNADIETRRANRERVADEIAVREDDIARVTLKIADLRADIEQCELGITRLQGEISERQTRLAAAEPLPEPKSTAELTQQLNEARMQNARRADNVERARVAAQLAAQEAAAKDLTTEIEALDKSKADALAKAEMPVPGLALGDDCILFDGVPFEQAHTSMQTKVGIALAMAMNPRLKVIIIRDASLLDAETVADIARMADESGYQVWMETVGQKTGHAVVIEDGAVIGAEPVEEGGKTPPETGKQNVAQNEAPAGQLL